MLSFSKCVDVPITTAAEIVIAVLERNGLRIVADVYVSAEEARKLSLDLPDCRIIGASDPREIARGLQSKGAIGPLIHCRAIIHDAVDGGAEISLSATGTEFRPHGAVSAHQLLETLLELEITSRSAQQYRPEVDAN